MAFEVEIKARVADRAALEKILRERYQRIEPFDKADIYFASAADPARTSFRLRKEAGVWTVTHKEKNVHDGIECNNELEFTVSDGDAFCAFAVRLGFFETLRKTKRGIVCAAGPDLNVELATVGGLGDFVEIECLVARAEDTDGARLKVRGMLDGLGVPADSIEPRYYAELLRGQNGRR